MFCFNCAITSCVNIKAGRTRFEPHVIPAARIGKSIRLLAVMLAAASLAACAQSSVVSQKSELRAVRQASLGHDQATSSMMKRRVAAVRRQAPSAPRKDAGDIQTASHGVASYYTEGTKTASGEKFNTLEMTAAHPTLPFGTKLRVTHGDRSVIVTVNDRGPFVRGRVLDLSTGAARAIGLTSAGVGRVTAEIVG